MLLLICHCYVISLVIVYTVPKPLFKGSSTTRLTLCESHCPFMRQFSYLSGIRLCMSHRLLQRHTWNVVPCRAVVRPIGSRWVYKVKYRRDGTVERHKIRLVHSFTQEYAIDYEETFAPVAQMPIVCTLLTSYCTRWWSFFQMDAKNLFLHGTLFEVVYIVPPLSYSVPPEDVCRLRRAVYEFKQAPCAWFECFHQLRSVWSQWHGYLVSWSWLVR